MARSDDLEADRQPGAREAGAHRRGRVPREVERDREGSDARGRLLAARRSRRGKRARGGRRIERHVGVSSRSKRSKSSRAPAVQQLAPPAQISAQRAGVMRRARRARPSGTRVRTRARARAAAAPAARASRRRPSRPQSRPSSGRAGFELGERMTQLLEDARGVVRDLADVALHHGVAEIGRPTDAQPARQLVEHRAIGDARMRQRVGVERVRART